MIVVVGAAAVVDSRGLARTVERFWSGVEVLWKKVVIPSWPGRTFVPLRRFGVSRTRDSGLVSVGGTGREVGAGGGSRCPPPPEIDCGACHTDFESNLEDCRIERCNTSSRIIDRRSRFSKAYWAFVSFFLFSSS